MQERNMSLDSRTSRNPLQNLPAGRQEGDPENFDDEISAAEREEWDETQEEGEEEHEEMSQPTVSVAKVATEREKTIEEILALADSNQEYDIFEDIGQPLVDKGDRVTYSIKKNGAFKGSVPHPFSYDQVQKRWGGGSYHVTLRSYKFATKPGGGYLKSQTKFVDEPEPAPQQVPSAQLAAPTGGQSGSPMELLAVIQEMNERNRAEMKAESDRLREEARQREERLEKEARLREERLEREAKEREQKAEKEGQSTIMLMMKMMENSQAQAQAAAKQQTDMMLALFKRDEPKEDKKSDKIFDMLMNVLLDKKGKDSGLDPITLHTMLADAQEKGYERANEMRELIREEAARMAARRGGDDDEEDEPKEEESATKSLLKTLAPMIAQIASNAMSPQQPTAPAPIPPQIRRQLPLPPPQQRVNPQAPARPMPGAVPRVVAQHAQPGAAQPVVANPQPAAARPAPAMHGLPRAMPLAQQKPQPPRQALPGDAVAGGRDGAATKGQPKVTTLQIQKELVSKTVLDLIGKDLNPANLISGKVNPEGTALQSLEVLAKHGIEAGWLVTNYTLDDMKAVAKANGVPDAIHPYLAKFHDTVTKRAAEQAANRASLTAMATAPSTPVPVDGPSVSGVAASNAAGEGTVQAVPAPAGEIRRA